MTDAGSEKAGQDFKELLEKCLRQAGLNPRTLHLELRRQGETELHLPETTIDSWLRPHSATGRPSLPRSERVVALLGSWLCGRQGVTATEQELVAAWTADASYRTTQRARAAPTASADVPAAPAGLRPFSLHRPSIEPPLPATGSPATRPNNLPLQLTAFIGRTEQLQELRHAVLSRRLCTLTGSGGMGKTRLALQLAAELLGSFADGVWLVDLAPTPEMTDVAQEVAGVLSLQEAGTGTFAGKAEHQHRPVARRLTEHLRDREVLLLLDNCDHVVASCATLVEELLQTCPRVTALCTSREPLGVVGELVYRVPPMAAPPVGAELSLDDVVGYESVRLFLDRAWQRRPDLEVAEPDLRAVVELCQRVEGSALAIELAAARVKMLSPRQILELLDDRFALLSSGSRTAAPRHQTLRSMIDWSYGDLSPGQKTLLERLSVFAGGFDLAAAQDVCAGEGLERFEILDLLGMLVDKSLVETDQHHGTMRYRLLATIRAYAAEKLAASGAEATVRRRHQEWYLALAERAEPALKGPDQLRWLDSLELDDDNLRAALDAGDDPVGAQRALRLAAALGHYWLVRGLISEGRQHLERALVRAGESQTVLRAKALAVAGHLAMFDADVDSAEEQAQLALSLSSDLGYRRGEAWALRTLGWVASSRERFSQAFSLQQRSLAAGRELADGWETGFSLTMVANLEARWGRFVEASGHYEESVVLRHELQDAWGLTWSLFRLGVLRTWQGRFGDAEELLAESLRQAERLRYGAGSVLTLLGLAQAAHLQGDQTTARRRFLEARAKGRDLEDRASLILSVVGLAAVATACRNFREARQHLDSDEAASASTTPSTLAEYLQARGRLARATGDRGGAAELHVQVLLLRRREEDARGIAEQLEELALLALDGGEADVGARLLALTLSRRRAMGAPVPPLYRPEIERAANHLAKGRDARVSAAWGTGPDLTDDEAIDLACTVGRS